MVCVPIADEDLDTPRGEIAFDAIDPDLAGALHAWSHDQREVSMSNSMGSRSKAAENFLLTTSTSVSSAGSNSDVAPSAKIYLKKIAAHEDLVDLMLDLSQIPLLARHCRLGGSKLDMSRQPGPVIECDILTSFASRS